MVADFYLPYVGGVEQHVRSLSYALSARGHEVAVATLQEPWGRRSLDQDGPVRIHRIPGLRQVVRGRSPGDPDAEPFGTETRAWAPPTVDPLLAAGLWKVAGQERPDVVHIHDWMGRSAWPLRARGIPVVSSLHYYTRSCATKNLLRAAAPCPGPSLRRCIPCAGAHYGQPRGTAAVALNWLGARIEDRTSARYLPVSRAAAEGNGLAPGPKVHVVPNLLAPGPEPDPDDPAVTAVLGTLPEEPFILFVGDLRTQKGIHVLLDAYARLHAPPPLVLIGKQTTDERITLPAGALALGTMPNAAVRVAWSRARFGVVPSVWAEPFGIVVIEAMHAGRPVVGSHTGGIADIVRHERDGLLVAPGDAAALAGAMERLLQDPALCERLGSEARHSAMRYQPDAVAAEVERVYTDVLARR